MESSNEFLTYEKLIKNFQCNISQIDLSLQRNKKSIYVSNLETQTCDTIIDNTEKRYNWSHIIFDPKHQQSPHSLRKRGKRDERSIYYCNELKHLAELLNFLLFQDSFVIEIGEDDVLDRSIYG